MPVPCPGPCNNAWRKAEEVLAATGAEHHITPSWGDPVQCWGCVDRTRQYLAELPQLLDDVLSEALDGTRGKTVGTIGRVGLHASWPGQASRLLVDRIVGEMAELQLDILVQRHVWPEDREPARSTAPNEQHHIRAIASALYGHWDWAMQHHPAAGESYGRGNANPGSQASSWHRTTLYFTKQHEQYDEKRLAPCPRCRGPWLVESRELRLVNDQPYVVCRDEDCQRVMTKAEYTAYVAAMHKSIQAAA